jgi:hypothetical protein
LALLQLRALGFIDHLGCGAWYNLLGHDQDESNPLPLTRYANLVGLRASPSRGGLGNLNVSTSLEAAPEGEDLACDDWSEDE